MTPTRLLLISALIGTSIKEYVAGSLIPDPVINNTYNPFELRVVNNEFDQPSNLTIKDRENGSGNNLPEVEVTGDPDVARLRGEAEEQPTSFWLSHSGGLLEGSLATLFLVILVMISLVIYRRNRSRVMLIRKPAVSGFTSYERRISSDVSPQVALRKKNDLPDLPKDPTGSYIEDGNTKPDQPADTPPNENHYQSLIFNIPRNQPALTPTNSREHTLSLVSVNSNYVTAIASPKRSFIYVNEVFVDPYDTIDGLGTSTVFRSANSNQSTADTTRFPTTREQVISMANGYSTIEDNSPKSIHNESELVQPYASSGNVVLNFNNRTRPEAKTENGIWKSTVTVSLKREEQGGDVINRHYSDSLETQV